MVIDFQFYNIFKSLIKKDANRNKVKISFSDAGLIFEVTQDK